MTDDGTGGHPWQDPEERTSRSPAPDDRTAPTTPPPRVEATGSPAVAPAFDQGQDPDDGGYLLPPQPLAPQPLPPQPPAGPPRQAVRARPAPSGSGAPPAAPPAGRRRRRRRQTWTFVGLLAGVVVVGVVAATVLTGLWTPFG